MGFITKTHALIDSRRNLRRLALTPRNCHDFTMALSFISLAKGSSFITDRAHHSASINQAIIAKGMIPVIPLNPNRLRRQKLKWYPQRKKLVLGIFFTSLKLIELL